MKLKDLMSKGDKSVREIQGERIEIFVPGTAFNTITQHWPTHWPANTKVRVWRTMLWLCVYECSGY